MLNANCTRRAAGPEGPAVVYGGRHKICPGTAHAFMNDTRPDACRPDDAAHAWRQMVAFLTEQLRR